MPEYNPAVAYEALAPLHWDAEEFDFGITSEDDEPQTKGEDLQLLFQEELESSSDGSFSWDGADSSSEEETMFDCLSSIKVPSGYSSNIKGILNLA